MAVLNTILLYPLLHNTIYIGKGDLFEVIYSLGFFGFFAAFNFWVLFSGIEYQNYGSVYDTAKFLFKETISDSECVGSNIWFYFCMVIIPSFLCMVKTLTN